MISYNEFKKVEMKIGTIKKVEEISGSKNLFKLKVDLGEEEKQAIAGLKEIYKPEELESKQFVFVTNLEPRKMMGESSEVMILAAVKDKNVVLVKPEKKIDNGASIL